MFNFFIENKLILSKPGKSCINQLLSMTHETYTSFDVGLEIRSVFFDITKAFDKVWHDGIIYKLKWNIREFTKPFGEFLKERKQRVILKGQVSIWENINAGVLQGSILGPLLFLIYINDLAEGLTTNANLFADDPFLFSVIYDTRTSANDLSKDLGIINDWTFQWKMNFNPNLSKQACEVIFSRKAKEIYHPPLVFNNTSISQSSSQKHVVVKLESIQYNACLAITRYLKGKSLPRIRFRITSVRTLVQKTRDVLQNLQKQKSSIPF